MQIVPAELVEHFVKMINGPSADAGWWREFGGAGTVEGGRERERARKMY